MIACLAAGQTVAVGTASAASGVTSIPAPGTITTIAGGLGGPGPARSISIAPCVSPIVKLGCGLAFRDGQVYFTDYTGLNLDAGVVRSLSLNGGQLTTPAGDGLDNQAGDRGPASQAGLVQPSDVSFDHFGNMLITDSTTVRAVAASAGTFYGQPMAAGHIYMVAGGGTSRNDGVPAIAASMKPKCAIVDQAGNIVICGPHSIRVVAASSGTFYGQPMIAGDVYTIAGAGPSSADGVPAVTALVAPAALAVDGAGNLLIADTDLRARVRLIAATTGTFYGQWMAAGDIYTIAGGARLVRDKVPANQTSLFPLGLTVDKAGNVVIADFSHNLIRVMAASTGRFYGQPMRAGFIYAVGGGGTRTRNGAVASSASFKHPAGVTVDSAGNVVVASQSFGLQVIATRTGTFYGVHMSAGHLYSVAGNSQPWTAGSGGPATKAQIFADSAVAFDRGNLVTSGWHIAHNSLNSTIRLVPGRSGTFFGQEMRAGHIYVIAGGDDQDTQTRFGVLATTTRIGIVGSVAVDSHGNLVYSDSDFTMDVLAAHAGTFYGQRMKTGFLYKIGGTGRIIDSGDGRLATKAGMDPVGIVVDGHGNVVFADTLRIRVIAAHAGSFYGLTMTAGHIYTIAGDGHQGTGRDGGPIRQAQFVADNGLARDGRDGLLVSDGERVRMIATATGTFFGVPMTAGDIYTVAGSGNPGSSGDGGPAITANISPFSLTVDAAGNLVFDDVVANKIRVVPASSGTFYALR